jgi:hypothetical protein
VDEEKKKNTEDTKSTEITEKAEWAREECVGG